MRTRTRRVLLVRDLLRREGLRGRSGHAESLARRVREIAGPTHLQVEVEPLLELLTPLNPLIKALDPALLDLTPERTLSPLASGQGHETVENPDPDAP